MNFLKFCDLANIGKGHDVQQPQWRDLWQVSTSTKSYLRIFARYHRFPDVVYLYVSGNCVSGNVGQGHDVRHLR